LSPCKSTSQEAIDTMMQIVEGIGGIPILIDADLHDRVTGTISHIPHIIASALVNMVKETDTQDGKMRLLAAGGFKDITRIASSSPEMWESIILSNKEHIRSILEKYISILRRFGEFIESSDTKAIYSFFETAKNYRNLFSSEKKGLINPVYEISLDVVDKPGIIGEIATILGNNGINIKNINISNSREFEQGCLRITLPDSGSAEIASGLLRSRGYRVYEG